MRSVWRMKQREQDEVLPPEVALGKCRDKTNLDGQADYCLARGKHSHGKAWEKTGGKKTAPMKRDDADDEGVQRRHRRLMQHEVSKHIIDDGKAEDRRKIGNHGATRPVAIACQHIKKARKEVRARGADAASPQYSPL